VTCKVKYWDVMLSSEAAQFISLCLLQHTVCSHAVVIRPVTFLQPKETPSLQTSFPPNVRFSHRTHYHGTVFLQNVFLVLEKRLCHSLSSWSPTSDLGRGGTCSIVRQSLWDLGWMRWNWGSFFSKYFSFPAPVLFLSALLLFIRLSPTVLTEHT
jgi:hypothetical protein